jgi:hypothetical protein
MALFDYSRVINKERQDNKVAESTHDKEHAGVSDVSVLQPSAPIVQPTVQSIVQPVVPSSTVNAEQPIWLRRISNDNIRPGNDPTVLLAQVVDSTSPANVGIICLKKSCVKPSVSANGQLDPGFSDIVISSNGVDLNGPYFRIEDNQVGRGAVRRTVTPQYLQDEWSRSENERMGHLREETMTIEPVMVKGDMQYGDNAK